MSEQSDTGNLLEEIEGLKDKIYELEEEIRDLKDEVAAIERLLRDSVRDIENVLYDLKGVWQ